MVQMIMPFAVTILVGYLIGCFNLAYIISKVKKVLLQKYPFYHTLFFSKTKDI